MANELTIALSITYTKNGKTLAIPSTSGREDVSGNGIICNVQSIGTGAGGEALALGDVTTPGFAYFKNLDATNYVEVGFDSGGFVTWKKLMPGQSCTDWLNIAAPYARANTAAVLLDYIIIDR